MLKLDDEPPHPGVRFAALAIPANALGAREAIVPETGTESPEAERQHVTSEGRLVANGIIHLERAGVAVRFDAASRQTLVELSTTGPLATVVATRWSEDWAALIDGNGRAIAALHIDGAGRPHLGAAPASPSGQPAIRLAIAARPALMRDYPAVRMALADTCDKAGIAAEMVLIDPAGFRDGGAMAEFG